MHYLVVSDIHGLEDGVLLIKRAIEKYKPVGVISAGDQCPYPGEPLFSSLISVRGNCDRFYEYGACPFPPLKREMTLFGRNVYITHGDSIWVEDLALDKGSIFISGHTHVPSIRKEDGVYLLNPGSPSRPRSSEGPTAALLSEEGLTIFSLMDFTIISTLSFSE